ncbi:MAG: hypothetical protein IPN76_15860 [Saprospiraceae bacterium]|nr:hypothetical protein [Saprospiraceae bacterium]
MKQDSAVVHGANFGKKSWFRSYVRSIAPNSAPTTVSFDDLAFFHRNRCLAIIAGFFWVIESLDVLIFIKFVLQKKQGYEKTGIRNWKSMVVSAFSWLYLVNARL